VRRGATGGWFSRLRGHALSRVCALWFTVLILLPFTAPFPSYQLHDSSGSHPFDAVPKDLKIKGGSDDQPGLPAHGFVVPASLNVIVVSHVRIVRSPAEHPPQHAVLRI
jgi:hypothetical protein